MEIKTYEPITINLTYDGYALVQHYNGELYFLTVKEMGFSNPKLITLTSDILNAIIHSDYSDAYDDFEFLYEVPKDDIFFTQSYAVDFSKVLILKVEQEKRFTYKLSEVE